MSKYFNILIIAMLLGSCNWMKTEIDYFEGAFEEVLEYNIKSGKPLLVYITNEQCQACNILKKQLEATPEVLEYLNDNLINYQYDISNPRHQYLNRLLLQYSFPTLLLFDNKGKIVSVIPGLNRPVKLKKHLEQLNINSVNGKFEYFYKTSQFNSFYTDLYNLLNTTHQAWLNYKKGDYKNAKTFVEEAIEIEPYFYNLFLASRIYSKLGKMNESNFYAREALKLKTKSNLLIYYKLITELESSITDTKDSNKEINNDYPILSLKKYSHDFGSLKRNEKAVCKFSFINKGNKPLVVSDVQSSCNCTISSWTKTPVPPGGDGELLVEYDTSKPGRFSKVLFLLSNGKIGTCKVMIKGNVL